MQKVNGQNWILLPYHQVQLQFVAILCPFQTGTALLSIRMAETEKVVRYMQAKVAEKRSERRFCLLPR